MTQESAPMPERDVSPATEADKLRLIMAEADIRWPDEHTRISPAAFNEWLDAALQEAADPERRKVVELLCTCGGGKHRPSWAWCRLHGVELSPPSSDRGASR